MIVLERENICIEPKEVFSKFFEINQIPRGSGDEGAISNFLLDFAKKRNIEAYQDEFNNIVMKSLQLRGMRIHRQ